MRSEMQGIVAPCSSAAVTHGLEPLLLTPFRPSPAASPNQCVVLFHAQLESYRKSVTSVDLGPAYRLDGDDCQIEKI
jgi:hypothetical protein